MTDCSTQIRFSMPRSPRVEVTFDDEHLTQDGGLLLLRQLDERLGLTAALSKTLVEWRDPRFVQHTLHDLTRSRVLAIAQGYEDCNDFGELRNDPLFKACNDRGADGTALASQPSLSRFEHRALGEAQLEEARLVLVRHAIRRWTKGTPPTSLVLDLDSTVDEAHGQQPFAFFNGYYRSHCYQQVFIFTSEGDLLWTKLVSGTANVRLWAIEGLKEVTRELRAALPSMSLTLRADNGFATPDLYDWCEDSQLDYVVNCGTHANLCTATASLVARAEALFEAGQPDGSAYVYGELHHRASTWRSERRIVAKAQRTQVGSDQRFVVTSLKSAPDEVYDFYAGRGQMENWIKDIKSAVRSDRTSTTEFFSNELRLLLHAVAYQLLHELRRVVPEPLRVVRLATLRLRLLRVAARVRLSARRLWVRLSAFMPGRDDWLATARAVLT